MTVLIVEDEKHAREHLEKIMLDIEPSLRVAAKLDTVQATVAWLRSNPAPDLIFLDIHLADDLSFKIFEQIEVRTPVIFTTAYDQYALQAFKVNSVDYLLKPIARTDLAASLKKYKDTRSTAQVIDFQKLLESMAPPAKTYRERFMVSRGEHVLSVPTGDVAWFEGEDRYVYLMRKDGKRYMIDDKLADLEHLLPPREFYRLNRSFIARFDAIRDILNLSKSRVKVTLDPPTSREVVVSSEKTADFKAWLNQ